MVLRMAALKNPLQDCSQIFTLDRLREIVVHPRGKTSFSIAL
jgi:hypothetical protein